MSACSLCHGCLGTDFKEVSDASQIEAMQFLNLSSLSVPNNVCLPCYDKISYIATLRLSLQSDPNKRINGTLSSGASISERPPTENPIDVVGCVRQDEDVVTVRGNDNKDGGIHEDIKKFKDQRLTLQPSKMSTMKCPESGCKRLFTKTRYRRSLRDHLQKFHNPEYAEEVKKLYQVECQECFALFKHRNSLERHAQLFHRTSIPATCPYCEFEVRHGVKVDEIQAHIRNSHPECVKDVLNHRKKSKKKETDLRAKIQCLLCPYQGIKSWNMQRHYRIIHKYDKSKADSLANVDHDHPDGFLCPQCGEHFINQNVLIKHILKNHSKISGEQCFFCPNKYADIQTHMKRSHSEVMNSSSFKCKKCIPELSLSSYNELMAHLKTPHRRIPSVKTKLTGSDNPEGAVPPKLRLKKEFTSKRIGSEGVKRVRKNKHNPIHMAGICPYCEHKYLDLLGHLRHKHQKEKTKEKKTCEICRESFGSIRELATHRQLHPNFKMHSCKRCPASFDTVLKQRKHRTECPKYKKKAKASSSAHVSDQGIQSLSSQLQFAVPSSVALRNDLNKPESLEFEGRGTVPCHICSKKFTRKTLLRQHYMKAHFFDPKKNHEDVHKAIDPLNPPSDSSVLCTACNFQFHDLHASVSHYLAKHATLSGQICPYCDNTWGWKKFNNLDEHVSKYHMLEMQSPVQTCITCKKNFGTYEELKGHRQCHEGGNKKVTVVVTSDQGSLNLHHIVGSRPEVANLGGVKCQLCNAFKLRKDHLKTHYIKYHSYRPKFAVEKHTKGTETGDLFEDGEYQHECSNCPEKFNNHHLHIKHLLKCHCSYSGSICPYCKGAFPRRFVDLQAHVTTSHLDMLTGYNVCNTCMVCTKSFSSYGEFRDHVQMHGDNYRQLGTTLGRKKSSKN